jgi:hypothetical protein
MLHLHTHRRNYTAGLHPETLLNPDGTLDLRAVFLAA